MQTPILNQFLPMSHPRAAWREMLRLLPCGRQVTLDLEDSVRSDFDQEEHCMLKTRAQDALGTLASRLQRQGEAEWPVYIRINEPDGPHHEGDIRALQVWSNGGLPLRLIVPKVSSAKMLNHLRRALVRATGCHPVLLPIIETVEGRERIPEIVDAVKEDGAQVIFGYFDYAYDAAHWPFMNPQRQDYWDLTGQVAHAVHTAGGRYIHGVFPFLNQPEALLAAKAMLMYCCPKVAGLCCLSSAQLSILSKTVSPAPLPHHGAMADRQIDVEEADRLAKATVEVYQQARRNHRSFAVIGERFISPHEYLAARRHLEET